MSLWLVHLSVAALALLNEAVANVAANNAENKVVRVKVMAAFQLIKIKR
jgi:hypothetical protein